MKNLLPSSIVLIIILSGCASSNGPSGNSNPSATAPITIRNLTFGNYDQFISTDSAMDYTDSTSGPWTEAQAQVRVSSIDLTYIFSSWQQPGFMDPYVRSLDTGIWYHDYVLPWLSSAHQIQLYYTTLNILDFQAAEKDQALIGQYFNTDSVTLALNIAFAPGSIVGGRQDDTYTSTIESGTVVAFKRLSDGKRGLIMVNNLNRNIWTDGEQTNVDIIREK